ncbi:MAG TPA: fibronectin type III domain-containing protein, partial [Vicinamibacterales bacterium]|nr:fibronectin type III domain-containing protein [Vicinamibacterales bacterium]
VTRRARFVAARVSLAALLVAVLPAGAATQSPTVVGESRGGDGALEYIGIIEQSGPQFAAIGYLTHVKGLSPSQLFNGPVSESTAMFTFSATAGITNHAQVGGTISIGAPGQMSIYFNPAGGATFGNPTSFTQGTMIAAINLRFFNVLSVIATDLGMSSGSAHGWQGAAASFVLGGQTYRIGGLGLTHDLDLFGKGVRTDPTTPASTTEFAASSVTTRQPPAPPVLSPAVVNGNQVTLSWQPGQDGPSPTSYTVVAAVSPGGPPVSSLTTSALTVSGGVPGGTYFVRVSASNDFGSSDLSNEVIVVVP